MSSRVWSSFQQAIFEDFKSGVGHTVIDAVPGSGKSTTAVEGLNHLPAKTTNVMMTSFSTQSVEDLKKKEPPWFVDVRTMNSLGNRAITNAFGRQNINKERVYGILDKVLGERPNGAELRAQFNGFRSRIKALVDMSKSYLASSSSELLEVADVFEMDLSAPDWIGVELAQRFGVPKEDVLIESAKRTLEACKEVTGNIDFNDQIWLPFVHQLPIEQYSMVIIDEGQDTSPAQLDMLIRACTKGGRMIMAGEDAQAIYAWRGAGLGMAPFVKRTNAKVLPLSISYRCCKTVVREAAKVVPGIQAHPEAPEGTVSSLPSDLLPTTVRAGDTVLSRKNAPLIRLFMELLSNNVAVGMQGRAIGESMQRFVRKSEATTASELIAYTHEWAKLEIERRKAKNPNAKIDHIEDHVRCVETLCEGTDSVREVLQNIDQLLTAPSGDKVLLSTVHRAKGLEWDRVFILHDTFPVNASYWMQYASRKKTARTWADEKAKQVRETEREELNILYVAVSRARKELIYVMPIAKDVVLSS